MRALEEEAERVNVLEGNGATPSMGLSQVRGGGRRKHKSDAEAQGHELAEHLHSLHGGAYMNDFMSGMAMAGGLGTGRYEGEGRIVGGSKEREAHAPVASKTDKGKPEKWIQKVVGEKGFKEGAFTKQALKHNMTPKEFAEEVISNPDKYTKTTFHRAMFVKNVAKGAGKLEVEINHGEEESSSDEEEKGGASMCGSGSDGRKARAAVVKKVMAEKGMSMIEASKYVKEHGLYKGGAHPRKRALMVDADAVRMERHRALVSAMEAARQFLSRGMPLPAVKNTLEHAYGKHIASEALVELGLLERD